MIRVTLDDPAIFDSLKKCYSNVEKNVASIGARRSVNANRNKFFKLVELTAKIEGEPCMSDHVCAIYYMCIPRVDWDACVKTLQDGLQKIALGCQDDRIIRSVYCSIVRPKKATKRGPAKEKEIVAEFYNAEEEMEDFLIAVEDRMKEAIQCWK